MNCSFAKSLIIDFEITWQGSLFVSNFIISYLFDFEGQDEEEKYNSLTLINGTFRFANFTKPLPTLKDFVAKNLSITINKKQNDHLLQ